MLPAETKWPAHNSSNGIQLSMAMQNLGQLGIIETSKIINETTSKLRGIKQKTSDNQIIEDDTLLLLIQSIILCKTFPAKKLPLIIELESSGVLQTLIAKAPEEERLKLEPLTIQVHEYNKLPCHSRAAIESQLSELNTTAAYINSIVKTFDQINPLLTRSHYVLQYNKHQLLLNLLKKLENINSPYYITPGHVKICSDTLAELLKTNNMLENFPLYLSTENISSYCKIRDYFSSQKNTLNTLIEHKIQSLDELITSEADLINMCNIHIFNQEGSLYLTTMNLLVDKHNPLDGELHRIEETEEEDCSENESEQPIEGNDISTELTTIVNQIIDQVIDNANRESSTELIESIIEELIESSYNMIESTIIINKIIDQVIDNANRESSTELIESIIEELVENSHTKAELTRTMNQAIKQVEASSEDNIVAINTEKIKKTPEYHRNTDTIKSKKLKPYTEFNWHICGKKTISQLKENSCFIVPVTLMLIIMQATYEPNDFSPLISFLGGCVLYSAISSAQDKQCVTSGYTLKPKHI